MGGGVSKDEHYQALANLRKQDQNNRDAEQKKREAEQKERERKMTQLISELQVSQFRGAIFAAVLVVITLLFGFWRTGKMEEKMRSTMEAEQIKADREALELKQQAEQERAAARLMADEQANMRVWLAIACTLMLVAVIVIPCMVCAFIFVYKRGKMAGEEHFGSLDSPMSDGKSLAYRKAPPGKARIGTRQAGPTLSLDGPMGSIEETWNAERGRTGPTGTVRAGPGRGGMGTGSTRGRRTSFRGNGRGARGSGRGLAVPGEDGTRPGSNGGRLTGHGGEGSCAGKTERGPQLGDTTDGEPRGAYQRSSSSSRPITAVQHSEPDENNRNISCSGLRCLRNRQLQDS